jgi:hypothetical protein
MATYLTRTPASAGNRKTFTISAWFKKNPLVVQNIMYSNVSQESVYQFTSTGQINYYEYSGGYTSRLLTNAVYTDGSAWYNVVLAVDTTQATSSNRLKMYVNGEQVTSFSAATYPSQNFESYNINNNSLQTIGANNGNDGFSGSMSHFNFIDGTAYDASAFGSTDATTGEWKINTSPSVTYGTNGFFILKDGNSVTDQSGNSNNFIVAGGILNNTEDCPSNNFATWNATDRWLGNTAGNGDFLRNGNNYFRTTSDAQKAVVRSTIGVTSGKYYCEMKVTQIERTWIGILNRQFFTSATNNFWTTGLSSGFFWYGNGPAVYNANNQTSSSYGGYANGDIVMMALDMDNYAWYLGKNGTWLNSGDPTSGATKTGSVTEESNFGTATLTDYGEVFFMAGDSSTAGVAQVEANFGNGVFQTTAVASAGTNASGIGIFEYDVPTGYAALSTKGLNL